MARKDASIALACSISKLVEHTRWQRTQRLCFTPNNKHCPTLSNTVQHMSNTTLSNTVQHKQHCPTQTTITPTNTDHRSHQYTTHKQNTSLTQPTHSQHHFTCIRGRAKRRPPPTPPQSRRRDLPPQTRVAAGAASSQRPRLGLACLPQPLGLSSAALARGGSRSTAPLR